jgi:hypothetical protein
MGRKIKLSLMEVMTRQAMGWLMGSVPVKWGCDGLGEQEEDHCYEYVSKGLFELCSRTLGESNARNVRTSISVVVGRDS